LPAPVVIGIITATKTMPAASGIQMPVCARVRSMVKTSATRRPMRNGSESWASRVSSVIVGPGKGAGVQVTRQGAAPPAPRHQRFGRGSTQSIS
jgi:hypothetical protein